ncbi:MAG: potassium transporter TrkG [Limnobacter sp.]|nr:potassium transporter TrkG [Limnobacter sp.]
MVRTLFPVLAILSFALTIFSLSMLVPMAYAWVTGEPTLPAFVTGFLVTFSIGLIIHLLTRQFKRDLKVRDGFLLVTLVWTTFPAFATIPFKLYMVDMSITDAYFEMVSALTTTGATVLTGLDTLPNSINLWRCFLAWMGGMGILILAVAVLPLLGVGGSQVFKAETPGPMKDSKLTPRITETAKKLYLIYVVLTAACLFSYKFAGMGWFDSFLHAATTVALSGFSSHDASFGFWNNPAIETVAVVYMLIAAINFSIHFLAAREKSLRPYRHCPEARWLLLAMFLAVSLITGYLLFHQQYSDFFEAFRYALFNTVSVATTTGYSSTDYGQWPIFIPLLMIFLSMFATAAGSTGGGIKMMRAVILIKQAFKEVSRTLHPRAVNPVRISGSPVDSQIILGVLAFMLMYGLSIITVTLLLIFSGLDAISALTGAIAMINCLGPALGELGPANNFAVLNDFQTWVCSFAMIMGRVELFPVLIIFTPAFWRK